MIYFVSSFNIFWTESVTLKRPHHFSLPNNHDLANKEWFLRCNFNSKRTKKKTESQRTVTVGFIKLMTWLKHINYIYYATTIYLNAFICTHISQNVLLTTATYRAIFLFLFNPFETTAAANCLYTYQNAARFHYFCS